MRRGKLLRLRVMSRLPGTMWPDLTAVPHSKGGSVYHQRVVFAPRGPAGHLTWWVTAPVRGVAFAAMVREVTWRAAGAGSEARTVSKPARPAR